MQIRLKNLQFSTLLFLSFTLSSCSFFTPYKVPVTQGTIINQEELSLLQEGLTMGQVQDLLGPPFGKDAFDPRHWEYVFYTTDEEFHPDTLKHVIVKFDEENYLSSWQLTDQKVTVRQ